MMMAMMWMVLAMVMFLLRPTSFRTTKPRGTHNDDHEHGPNNGGPRGPEPPSIS